MKILNAAYLPAFILGIFLVFGIVTVHASTFYVSVTGNDTNSGIEQGKPLRTIQAGVNKLQPGDKLFIRGGIYRETVTFPHNGSHGKPIIIEAYKGEKVIVSGCDPITTWCKYKNNIWKAAMPWTMGIGRNQVFYNGEVMLEARFPDTPEPGLEMPVSGLSKLWPTFGYFSNPDPVKKPERIVSKLLENQPDDYWKGAIYYGIHYGGWSAQTGIIESSKSGEITVGDRTKTWWSVANNYAADDGRGMIVGHMNALDQPGEWLWQDSTMYFITPDGSKPDKLVEAKHRNLAFDLSGREYIQIKNLNVSGASMRLDNSAYCTVDGCNLEYISHFTRFYDIGIIETTGNTLRSGETGIFVDGHDNSFLNCSIRFSAGAGFYLRGYHHTIHNCLIDEIDYTSHYLNAITDAVSDYPEYENFLYGGHEITFNTMRNAGRHFFNIYGNGCNLNSRNRGPMDYAATLFAHNHLYNGMLETRDAGLITGYYCSGGTLNNQNTQIIYNVIHDTFDLFGIEIDKLGLIYLDAGTCNVDVFNNLLWAAPGSHQRGFWYNTANVGVREGDNIFHSQFTRTSAQLKPEDFPKSKPFRFGHDFKNPPSLPQWSQIESKIIEAESSKSMSDGIVKTDKALTGMKDGDWFVLDGINLKDGWQSVVMSFASGVKEMNTDGSARKAPRHIKATDPLVLESTVNDGADSLVKKQWSFVYNTLNGTWLRFNQVPLGNGYKRLRVIYGNDVPAPRFMEVRLDKIDGPLAGRVDLTLTDKPRDTQVQLYGEAFCEISPEATGTRDVFLVFHTNDGKSVGSFEYFRFEQYRGLIPLQKNEVKLEVRAGSKDGDKIGEFYPRFTGGEDVFRSMVATLEPMKSNGDQRLWFVVRSSTGREIGAIDRITFSKGKEPLIVKGLGVEPLKRNNDFVYPEQTNIPLAPDKLRLPSRLKAKLKEQGK